jgi:hypothetical protein
MDPGAQSPNAKPSGPAQRPAAGPVVPLTAMQMAPEELVGGGRASTSALDATGSRVLDKGELAGAPTGRADDFSWPRGALNVQPSIPDARGTAAPVPDDAAAKPTQPSAGQRTDSSQANPTSEQKPVQRRPRRPNPYAQRPPFFFQNFFR